MSRDADADYNLYRLLVMVRRGGCIVGGKAFELDAGELAYARRERRVFEDKDGFVYVYLP